MNINSITLGDVSKHFTREARTEEAKEHNMFDTRHLSEYEDFSKRVASVAGINIDIDYGNLPKNKKSQKTKFFASAADIDATVDLDVVESVINGNTMTVKQEIKQTISLVHYDTNWEEVKGSTRGKVTLTIDEGTELALI
mgnify:CR=1 FL=1